MWINLNRTGFLPEETSLMKKLDLNLKQFDELIIDAQEYGMDIKPEIFELKTYCKLNLDDMQYGNDTKLQFGYKDFLKYKKLEVAGTILNFLELLITNITSKALLSDNSNDQIERDYEKVMTVYGKKKVILSNDQLEISIDKFLEPFITIFMKVGTVFEAYDALTEEYYNENEIIKEYSRLDFKEIESFLKLYEDGQLN